MPAPIDYSLGVESPSTAIAQGLNVGSTLANADVQRQTQSLALQQAQQAAQRQAQQRADTAAFSKIANPTARDYAQLVMKYPELKDSYKSSWDAVSAEQQKTKLDTAAPVFAALQSGRPDLAEQLLQQNLDALKNSGGNPKDIQAAETWLKMVQQQPNHAAQLGGVFLASVMGPEKFEAAFGKIGSERRADETQPFTNASSAATTAKTVSETKKTDAETPTIAPRAAAEIANINSQIAERAGKLALDSDKLASETALKLQELTQKAGEIHPDARKVINEAAGGSVMASNSAAQMRGLASQFDAAAGEWKGGAGAVDEAVKSFTGTQDYMTQLRREYTRIRATQINALLPPGPASDKDIQNAQAGFLKETANPKEIASWLRGMAKLQDYQAKYEDARGEWVATVGHLGKTNKDIEVGGVKVPAGYTLTDYLRKTLAAPGPATTPQAPRGNYMNKYGVKQ